MTWIASRSNTLKRIDSTLTGCQRQVDSSVDVDRTIVGFAYGNVSVVYLIIFHVDSGTTSFLMKVGPDPVSMMVANRPLDLRGTPMLA